MMGVLGDRKKAAEFLSVAERLKLMQESIQKGKRIDILKIDSQGFELDILRGCSDLLHDSKINLVLVELTFTDMYQGLPNVEELLKLLYENNFVLSGFYRQHFQNGYLSWADGLFVNKRILER